MTSLVLILTVFFPKDATSLSEEVINVSTNAEDFIRAFHSTPVRKLEIFCSFRRI